MLRKCTAAHFHIFNMTPLPDNFVAMVRGSKTFCICAPHATAALGGVRVQSPYLHEALRNNVGVDGGAGDAEADVDGRVTFQVLSVRLGAGDMLYLPAGWYHRTSNEAEALSEGEGEGAPPAQEQDGLSLSVNFFLASCYSAIGVVVPDIVPGDWPVGFEPGTA